MQDSEKLTNYIESLNEFVIEKEADSYTHMGAVVVDGILQASLNYLTVVKPRVNDVLEKYPNANTTSAFLQVCYDNDLKKIIRWNDDKKPNYILSLLNFLKKLGLEKVYELREWLDKDENFAAFVSNNKGIGEVTAQYFRILTGSQSVKVDRHVKNFLFDAGLDITSDELSRSIVMHVAKEMNIKPTILDYSIWKYQTTRRKRRE